MSLDQPPNIPPSVKDDFARIQHLYVEIRIRWQDFQEVFGQSEGQINLLNTIAPVFFWHAQTAIQDDMDMALSRLTDCKEMGGKNLTLDHLISKIEKSAPPRPRIDTPQSGPRPPDGQADADGSGQRNATPLRGGRRAGGAFRGIGLSRKGG